MLRWLLVIAAAVSLPVTGHAQVEKQAQAAPTASAVDVSETLHPIREKAKLPGMAVVVVRGREVIAQGVSGIRKRGEEAKVTIDDRWHLGSCTKSMTATLIGMLVEEGKLDWSTTIAEVFPELKPLMKPGWESVTVEQLLANRGGAPNSLDKDGLWGALFTSKARPRDQRLALLRGVIKHPPVHAPGTKYEYSNAGFAIAGAMAEKVCGKPWEELMKERIFTPLGMTTAGFGPPGNPKGVDQPWGHRQDGKPSHSDNPYAIAPAGLVHCSLPDWAKYIAQHAGGEREDRPEGVWLLKPETFARLHKPFVNEEPTYGGGWGVLQRPWARGPGGTGRVLTHSGSNTMWFVVAWVAPEKDMAVLVATNAAGDKAAKACDDVAGAMVRRFIAEK
jgi:CubicO group peptidase (beta-lactamase class C family)